MSIDALMNVEVDRQLPDAESDSTEKALRGGRYGEAYTVSVLPTMDVLADEGTFRLALNPTPGTGIAAAINASVSETAGNFLNIKNNDAINNGRAKFIYMHYLRLILTALPASATSVQYFLKLDIVNRYTSGGTVLTPSSPNLAGGQASVAQLWAGALTTVAPSQSAALVSRGVMRSIIPSINDEWIFNFGTESFAGSISLAAANAQRMTVPCAPIIIGPQQNLSFQVWAPVNSVTPPSFELEVGWFER